MEAQQGALDALGKEASWQSVDGSAAEVAAQLRSAAELCARHDRHEAAANLVARSGASYGAFGRPFPDVSGLRDDESRDE